MIKIISIVFSSIIIIAVWSFNTNVVNTAHSDALELLIESNEPSLESDSKKYFRLDAYIINHGKDQVKLVQPGDGWRTPITKWSVQLLSGNENQDSNFLDRNGARCGNVNSLEEDDLIYLKPGEKKQLKFWYGYPDIPNVIGKYGIRLSYTNEPKQKWKGLGFHDKRIMKKVKKTDKVELISNEIVIEIKE